jgi:hypothetical protein
VRARPTLHTPAAPRAERRGAAQGQTRASREPGGAGRGAPGFSPALTPLSACQNLSRMTRIHAPRHLTAYNITIVLIASSFGAQSCVLYHNTIIRRLPWREAHSYDWFRANIV